MFLFSDGFSSFLGFTCSIFGASSSSFLNIRYNNPITTNTIKGDITLNNDSILFISIPYNKGFKAYVNGKEIDKNND